MGRNNLPMGACISGTVAKTIHLLWASGLRTLTIAAATVTPKSSAAVSDTIEKRRPASPMPAASKAPRMMGRSSSRLSTGGAPGMETPLGLFYVQAKFRPSEPVLGAYAFQTSGYSKLSDWPGGGVVGVHGTNTPQLIGQAVSHGCVRLRNVDIEFLRSVVRVGTPIKIVAG